MTAILTTPAGTRPRPLAELDGAPVLGFVGPNWFAPVMGTGIIAVALVGLPVALPGAAVLATAVWVLAALLLTAVVAAFGGHWLRHRDVARRHLDDPVMAHFHGAVPMALMTVGAGALLVGHRVVGAGPALAIDVVLWSGGTLLGLASAVLVPLRVVRRHGVRSDAVFGGWLMPVVPPMVSAATGALLVARLPIGTARTALLVACYAFVVLSLVASIVVIGLLVHRLVRHGPGASALAPTLWIVLGPLGQSVTAVHHLGLLAPGSLPAPYGEVLRGLGVGYGLPVVVVALGWLGVAAVLTARAARVGTGGLPFTLAWWSFTFPVGTVVTGTSALAAATGSPALLVASLALFGLLVTAWLVVLPRTVGGVYRGRLLRAPAGLLTTPGPAHRTGARPPAVRRR